MLTRILALAFNPKEIAYGTFCAVTGNHMLRAHPVRFVGITVLNYGNNMTIKLIESVAMA
jgi:hypothetical protein